jgi:hypothetical protein
MATMVGPDNPLPIAKSPCPSFLRTQESREARLSNMLFSFVTCNPCDSGAHETSQRKKSPASSFPRTRESRELPIARSIGLIEQTDY